MKIEKSIYIEDIYTFSSDADLHCQGDSFLYGLHSVVYLTFFGFWRLALAPGKDISKHKSS